MQLLLSHPSRAWWNAFCGQSSTSSMWGEEICLHFSTQSPAVQGQNPKSHTRAEHTLPQGATPGHSPPAPLSCASFIRKAGKLSILNSGCGDQLRSGDCLSSQASRLSSWVTVYEGILTNDILLLQSTWVYNLHSNTETKQNWRVCTFNAKSLLKWNFWKSQCAASFLL